jgi:hypothetical protein
MPANFKNTKKLSLTLDEVTIVERALVEYRIQLHNEMREFDQQSEHGRFSRSVLELTDNRCRHVMNQIREYIKDL